MKSKFLIIPLLAAFGLGFMGCDSKKKQVEQFAKTFGTHLEERNLDSLKIVYPDIEKADSILFRLNPENIEVTRQDDGTYEISYDDKHKAYVKVDDNGKIEVVSSKGMFAYEKKILDFAKKAGALKEGQTDAELADVMENVEDMASELYLDFKAERANAVKLAGSKITKDIMFMMDEGKGYFIIENTTDQPMPASDYQLQIKYNGMYNGFESHTYDFGKGKPIPAHGTVTYPFSFSGHVYPEDPIITIRDLSMDEFLDQYKPTGKEYKEYIKEHGDNSGSLRLNDGPYNIAGKIGGKYPIHMVLEKGMKEGYYYYDKSGPSARLRLTVKTFSPKSGKLVVEERNDKDQITGTFTGKLTPTSFDCEMRAFTGKTYDCKLTVSQE